MQDKISGKDFEELQRRIRGSVDALAKLGETPTSLALKYGLGKDYIRDIISVKPRKTSISFALLPRIAAALRVDEEYLTLKQTVPRKPRVAGTALQTVRFGGRLKVGRWEVSSVETEIPAIPSVSVPGLTIDVAYTIEDETLAGMGIHAGMVLYAEAAGKSKPGDVVVIRRTMGPLVELSARVKTGDRRYELRLPQAMAPIEEPNQKNVKEAEVAVVRVAQMRLG